ncbi:MAG: hypothetical protein KAI17_16850, partial [Thiotrichaceae bacterium]|nr:hypothetical protein [Thiotrichaceae bacterium]
MDTANLVLYEPERTTTGDDAGGYRTSNEIISNELNNLFPPPSRVAATYGNVAYQKFFITAKEAGATLAGAHCILSEVPDNPDGDVMLVYTGSHSDQLLELRETVESYIIHGSILNSDLLERQIKGQRTLEIYQPIEADLPKIGDVIVVSQNEGEVGEFEQFLRITGYTDSIREFVTSNQLCGTFSQRVITLKLNEPLLYTFDGDGATCDKSEFHVTQIRGYNVADAAKFYGVSKFISPAIIGDTKIEVASVYGRLAPSTQTEETLVDQTIGSDKSFQMTSGNNTV